jgi:hypothetical protein
MATTCISLTALLVRDFLIQHELCDSQRARQLASRLDWELRQCDVLETEDGTTFVRQDRRNGRDGHTGRPLPF